MGHLFSLCQCHEHQYLDSDRHDVGKILLPPKLIPMQTHELFLITIYDQKQVFN